MIFLTFSGTAIVAKLVVVAGVFAFVLFLLNRSFQEMYSIDEASPIVAVISFVFLLLLIYLPTSGLMYGFLVKSPIPVVGILYVSLLVLLFTLLNPAAFVYVGGFCGAIWHALRSRRRSAKDRRRRRELEEQSSLLQQQQQQESLERQRASQERERLRISEERAKDNSDATCWVNSVGYDLPSPLDDHTRRHALENAVRSLPRHPDFRFPAATLSGVAMNQANSDKIFAHYRRAIMAYYQWRLEAGEDREDLLESMKRFLWAAGVERHEEEAAAVDRLAKPPSTPDPVQLDPSRLAADIEAIKSAGFPPDFEKQEIERARRKYGV